MQLRDFKNVKKKPHTIFVIRETSQAGRHSEAQNMCDELVLYYRDCVQTVQDLFIEIERKKRETIGGRK